MYIYVICPASPTWGRNEVIPRGVPSSLITRNAGLPHLIRPFPGNLSAVDARVRMEGQPRCPHC